MESSESIVNLKPSMALFSNTATTTSPLSSEVKY